MKRFLSNRCSLNRASQYFGFVDAMDFARASFGVFLPWACGALLVVWGSGIRKANCGLSYALGYGLPAGMALLILWMRGLALFGCPFSLTVVALPFAVLLPALLVALLRMPRSAWLSGNRPEWRALPLWGRVIWWGILGVLALRGAQLLMEILWRPSFGWDSWAHWATKAKVWFSLGTIVPFGSSGEVLSGIAQYTDANPHYPAGIPLIQVWMALCVGSWDDTLVNLPWLAFGICLGLGFYSQLRAATAGPLFAIAATYLLLSLPFLGVHVALPGYADLPLATFVGLATFSFWRWSVERRWEHLAVALLLALCGPMLKTPGWIWLALLAPAALPIVYGRHGWRLFFALGAAGSAALLFLAQYDARVMGYQLHAGFQPVWRPLMETMFALNNWHLLWYAGALAPALFGRALLSPRLAGLTAYLLGGFFFLFVVFFFSNAALWVSDLSTVNRALLHLVPTLVFALALLALGVKEQMHRARADSQSNLQIAAPD